MSFCVVICHKVYFVSCAMTKRCKRLARAAKQSKHVWALLQYKFSRVQKWSSLNHRVFYALNDLSIKIQFDFSIIIVLFAISPKCANNIFATFFSGCLRFPFCIFTILENYRVFYWIILFIEVSRRPGNSYGMEFRFRDHS